MIQKSIANYVPEQMLFKQLVQSDREPNILLFQGKAAAVNPILFHIACTRYHTPHLR